MLAMGEKEFDSTKPGANTKKRLHTRLVGIIKQARLIDLRTGEASMNPTKLTALRTLVAASLTACCILADDLFKLEEDRNHLDSLADSTAASDRFARNFVLQLDEPVEQKTSRLQDIAFIVRLELRSRLRRLLESPITAQDWSTLEACDSSLRTLLKAGSTLEHAVCTSLGIDQELDFETELQKSLAIRNGYARLRRVVSQLSKEIESDVGQRLRYGGTQIAMLMGRDYYGDLRVNDRFQFHRFQCDILNWLRGESFFDKKKAEKIWQNFVAFTGLLTLVNNREELVNHDRRLLLQLNTLLSTPPDTLQLRPNWSAKFESLRGLDDHIEKLFKSGHNDYLELWAPAVTKLLTC